MFGWSSGYIPIRKQGKQIAPTRIMDGRRMTSFEGMIPWNPTCREVPWISCIKISIRYTEKMCYEIARIVPAKSQCQRNYHVGNLAIVAVNPTYTLLETAFPRHLYPHWQTTQHTLQLPVQYYDLLHQLRCRTTSRYLFVLLLRLLVAIVGCINNLQLRSLLNLALAQYWWTPPIQIGSGDDVFNIETEEQFAR